MKNWLLPFFCLYKSLFVLSGELFYRIMLVRRWTVLCWSVRDPPKPGIELKRFSFLRSGSASIVGEVGSGVMECIGDRGVGEARSP